MDKACRVRALVQALLALVLACTRPASAATVYATIEFTEGSASIVDATGSARPARVGEMIYEGETIVTAKDGELQARTSDSGLLALRSGSKVKIDAYRAQADAADTSVLSLVQGTLRSISGWIGKYNGRAHVVRTSTATIGIRGTDHEPLYIAPGAGAPGPAGTYDKVNSGATFIESKGGRINVDPNRAGFAPHDGTAPRVLEKIPEFFKPTKNEARITERKAQLEKEMEQMRLERQKAVAAEKQKAAEAEKAEKEKAAQAKDSGDKKATEKNDKEAAEKSEKSEKGEPEKSEKEEPKKAPRKHRTPPTK